MSRQQNGRLNRLEHCFGAQLCVAHQRSIFFRDAAGMEEGTDHLCDRCGRPAERLVIEFEVVPDRTKE